MVEIQWEEPPKHLLEDRREMGKYRPFAQALRQNQGKWAVLPSPSERTEKGAKATAQNIKRGKTVDFKPAGTFDAVVDPETKKIYVCYKGEPTKEEKPAEAGALPKQQKKQREDENEPSVGEVRQWAREQGMDVPDRGVLSKDIFDKYREAVARGESGLGLRVVKHAE